MNHTEVSPLSKAETAVAYARDLGWRILPSWGITDKQCDCGKADCQDAGKHPIGTLCPKGLKDASSDPKVIAGWWAEFPNANIAARDLLILDVDDDDALEALYDEARKNDSLDFIRTQVVQQRTGRGYQFFFLAHAEVQKPASKLFGKSLDLRAGESYGVVPRSKHVSEREYAWIISPFEQELQQAPEWLVRWIKLALKQKKKTGKKSSSKKGLRARCGASERLKDHPGASEGERNDVLCSLVGAELNRGRSEAEVQKEALAWGARCDPPYPSQAVDKTVRGLATSRQEEKEARAVEAAKTVTTSEEDDLPWKPFPTDALPKPLAMFVREAAKAIGCDEAYIAIPLLVALAAAIGNSRVIKLKQGWAEPSALWGCIIGNSGDQKSPALSQVRKLIDKRQAEMRKRYEEEHAIYEQHLVEYEQEFREWKRSKKEPGTATPEKPVEPIESRLLVTDITLEALVDRLRDNPRGLLVFRDELNGWLSSFDQYRSGGGGSDTAHYLSMHRAEPLHFDRKTDRTSIFVPRATVSVVGGVQPVTLATSLSRTHFENGLAARFLMAMPPRRPKRWTDAVVSDGVIAKMERLYDRLLGLEMHTDEKGQANPVVVSMTPKALAAFIVFYNSHAKRQHLADTDLGAALSKLEGMAARIALIFSLVRQTDSDVTESDINDAIQVIEWFCHETERVYNVLLESEEAREARRLIEFIERRGGEITANDLRRRSRLYETSEDATNALDYLVQAELGNWANKKPATGGRVTRVFRLAVSPRFSDMRENKAEVDHEDTDTALENEKHNGEEDVTTWVL